MLEDSHLIVLLETIEKKTYSFETDIVELNRPRMGLYLPTMLWKDMYDFSPDSVLLVLCSEHYDGNEYIRDYDKYIEMVGGNKDRHE